MLSAADFASKRANNEKGSFDVRAVQLRVALDDKPRDLACGLTARVHLSGAGGQ
jgi:hypothetical protein